jgi:hypothetical protein
MQDFFRNFSRLKNRHVRPCPLLRRTVTRRHYPRQKDANQNYAEIKVGRNNAPLREFGRTCGLERLFWLKRGVRYQLIRNSKINSCSLRKPGAQTGVRLIHLASVRKFVESNLK